jgi:very-short-patch-repair endonuclease
VEDEHGQGSLKFVWEVSMSNDAPFKQKQTKRQWQGTYPHAKEAKSHAFAKSLRRKMTHAEVILWQNLRRNAIDGIKFRRQHPIGPYIADFACLRAKLIVEVDGETHASEGERFHDARRRAFVAQFGWMEIRVGNSDVYKNLDGVLEAIWRETNARLAHLTQTNPESDVQR